MGATLRKAFHEPLQLDEGDEGYLTAVLEDRVSGVCVPHSLLLLPLPGLPGLLMGSASKLALQVRTHPHQQSICHHIKDRHPKVQQFLCPGNSSIHPSCWTEYVNTYKQSMIQVGVQPAFENKLAMRVR
jgi:hypothetical protein